jgi:hypothetical protein
VCTVKPATSGHPPLTNIVFSVDAAEKMKRLQKSHRRIFFSTALIAFVLVMLLMVMDNFPVNAAKMFFPL